MSTKSPIETVFKSIRETLTDKEKIELAQRLVDAQLDLRKEEEEKASVMKDLNARVKKAHDLVSVLTDDYARGETERMIECQWLFDFGEGVKNLIRIDTREIVETKELSVEEKQIPIGLGDSRAVEQLVAAIPELPTMTCPNCEGAQQINVGDDEDRFEKCELCSGTGRIVDKETLDKQLQEREIELDGQKESDDEPDEQAEIASMSDTEIADRRLVAELDQEIETLSKLDDPDENEKTKLANARAYRAAAKKRIARAEKKRRGK